MRISLNSYEDSRYNRVVKGWWGDRKFKYVADNSSWSLWVTNGDKVDTDRQPAETGEIDPTNSYERTFDNALSNIAQYFRWRS